MCHEEFATIVNLKHPGTFQPKDIRDLIGLDYVDRGVYTHRKSDSKLSMFVEAAQLLAEGRVDLLFFLDPSFPFYNGAEEIVWVPDLSDDAPPLLEQLQLVDERVPWRTLYISNPDQHPVYRGSLATLLTDRYIDPSMNRFPRGLPDSTSLGPWADDDKVFPIPASDPDLDIDEWVERAPGSFERVHDGAAIRTALETDVRWDYDAEEKAGQEVGRASAPTPQNADVSTSVPDPTTSVSAPDAALAI